MNAYWLRPFQSAPRVACSTCQDGACSTPEACEVTPYDVETSRPWLTALIFAVAFVGAIAMSAVLS
jgi:hypothetical protein